MLTRYALSGLVLAATVFAKCPKNACVDALASYSKAADFCAKYEASKAKQPSKVPGSCVDEDTCVCPPSTTFPYPEALESCFEDSSMAIIESACSCTFPGGFVAETSAAPTNVCTAAPTNTLAQASPSLTTVTYYEAASTGGCGCTVSTVFTVYTVGATISASNSATHIPVGPVSHTTYQTQPIYPSSGSPSASPGTGTGSASPSHTGKPSGSGAPYPTGTGKPIHSTGHHSYSVPHSTGFPHPTGTASGTSYHHASGTAVSSGGSYATGYLKARGDDSEAQFNPVRKNVFEREAENLNRIRNNMRFGPRPGAMRRNVAVY